jgi:biotin operon repressor
MAININKTYVVSVEDTINYGITSAAIIGRIRMWCEYNQKNKVKDRYHLEFWWSGFMSSKVLSEQLGISKKTIETNLSKLLKDGVLIKGVFNKKGYDRTSWYRVNPFPQIKEMISSNQVNPFTQIKEMDILKSRTPIPVSTSVIIDVKTSVIPPVNPVEDRLKELNELITINNFLNNEERGMAYMERNKLEMELKELITK